MDFDFFVFMSAERERFCAGELDDTLAGFRISDGFRREKGIRRLKARQVLQTAA